MHLCFVVIGLFGVHQYRSKYVVTVSINEYINIHFYFYFVKISLAVLRGFPAAI